MLTSSLSCKLARLLYQDLHHCLLEPHIYRSLEQLFTIPESFPSNKTFREDTLCHYFIAEAATGENQLFF